MDLFRYLNLYLGVVMMGNPVLFWILMASLALLLSAIVANIIKRPKSRSDLRRPKENRK